MSSAPTLSVVVANFNHGHMLSTALEAILSQSLPPTEVIVVDDASNDHSIDVIESFVRRDPTVRLLRNEMNRGANCAFMRGVRVATGEFVYCAAADDRVLPGFFEKSLRLLQEYPAAGLCCSDPVTFRDESGLQVRSTAGGDVARYFFPAEFVQFLRSTGFWLASNTAIHRRDAMLAAGGMRPELRWYSDWFEALVVAFRHGVAYIPEPLAALRLSNSSYSARASRRACDETEAIGHLWSFLSSKEYADVLPAFIQSQALSIFGVPLLQEVWARRQVHWLPLSLVGRLVANDVRATLAAVIPQSALNQYRRWNRQETNLSINIIK